jgi:hypothetical protein
VDAVVSLGGAGIADGRWTEARKRAIRESRLAVTRGLVESMGRQARKPSVFLSASAIGYYGNRGPERVDEGSPSGDGFLAEVCREWESAAMSAAHAGTRTVLLRFGVVLSARGGALAKMLPPFRWGLGGPVGRGRQGLSWVALDDVARAIGHLMRSEDVAGPVNVVAPDPVPQRAFAQALGRAVSRPAVLPLPALAVRALFGRMGEEVLLSGCFAVPARLEASGFRFAYPRLDAALSHALRDG